MSCGFDIPTGIAAAVTCGLNILAGKFPPGGLLSVTRFCDVAGSNEGNFSVIGHSVLIFAGMR